MARRNSQSALSPVPWTYRVSLGVLAAVVTAYVIVAPFTKVEESFNVQAIHDLLFLNGDLAQFDHLEFPGVVPRTFLGALAVAAAAAPVRLLLMGLAVPLQWQKWIMLHVARMILGWALAWAHHRLARALATTLLCHTVGVAYLWFTLTQFHGMFWGSRPLPNVFALVPTTLAIAAYVQHVGGPRGPANTKFTSVIWLLGLATLVLRSELAILCAVVAILEVRGTRRVPFNWTLVRTGITTAAISIALSMNVDSIFWQQKYLWPELRVFLFNTWANKSHLWGTSPWHAYGTTHLPKLLLGALPWSAIGLIASMVGSYTGNSPKIAHKRNKQTQSESTSTSSKVHMTAWTKVPQSLFVVASTFTAVYSLLPHKEARFIFYVVPMFNCIAATAVARLCNWLRRQRFKRWVVILGLAPVSATAVVSLLASAAMAAASAWNYPGGDLMACLALGEEITTAAATGGSLALIFRLLGPRGCPAWIPGAVVAVNQSQAFGPLHLDVYAAMSGASRFVERVDWRVSKAEGLALGERQWRFGARVLQHEDWIAETKNATASSVPTWNLQGCVFCIASMRKRPWARQLQAVSGSDSKPRVAAFGLVQTKPCACLVTRGS